MPALIAPILAIPIEIRELIYDLIFEPRTTIKITAAPAREYEYSEDSTFPSDFESWAITPQPLSSQLLRVNKQFYTEGLSFLYSLRIFDLTARESSKLLLHNIGTRSFSQIRHVIIDWDALQNFAWDLSKDEYREGLAGLRCIELATWRIRHMRGTSVRWRNVKSYERMSVQAASDIISKHAQIRILAEQYYQRRASMAAIEGKTSVSNKVKWRFVMNKEDLKEGEHVVDVQADLELLRATQDEATEGGFSLSMMDPF